MINSSLTPQFTYRIESPLSIERLTNGRFTVLTQEDVLTLENEQSILMALYANDPTNRENYTKLLENALAINQHTKGIMKTACEKASLKIKEKVAEINQLKKKEEEVSTKKRERAFVIERLEQKIQKKEEENKELGKENQKLQKRIQRLSEGNTILIEENENLTSFLESFASFRKDYKELSDRNRETASSSSSSSASFPC